MLRTTCSAAELTSQAVVRVYKQLKMAERAYHTIKDALNVRPSATTLLGVTRFDHVQAVWRH